MPPEPGAAPGRLLTPADVRRLLAEHGIAPRKGAGQNFVVDANTVRKVVRDADVAPGDLVCEVGPGLGSLTLALRSAGARVVAVEIDAGLVRALRAVLGDDPGVALLHADALTVDWRAVVAGAVDRWSPKDTKFVANLPYNIATPVVLGALGAGVFHRLLVMVQREVGRRWTARVGDAEYGAVSVKVAAQADARVAAAVSRTAFYPSPHVDSVTVDLRPRPWDLPVDRDRLFGLLEQGFGQRRKRLRNALAAPGRPPVAVEAALAGAELDPGARAEELDLAAWVRLAPVLA